MNGLSIPKGAIDELEKRIGVLEKRISELTAEQQPMVRGWREAEKVSGLCAKTIKKRMMEGRFPAAIAHHNFTTGSGQVRTVPVWRRKDLLQTA